MERYKSSLHLSLPGYMNDISSRFQENDCCSDAVITVGGEKISLCFARCGESAYQVIFNAISEIRSILPEASIKRISPDLIPESKLCQLLNLNESQLTALCSTKAREFPAKINSGKGNTWHLKDILQWMYNSGHYKVNRALYETSLVTQQINAMNKIKHQPVALSSFDRPVKYAVNKG
ncbi:hypothetical protein [Amphritea sp. HPY]|uniref:hypothetical protein n=1 Tax=Amphritea sp. HPY TaxID=3421652 RepID=UPI003D7D2437